MRAWPLVALLLAAACGTGTDGKPVAPPTTPEPVAPEPPTVRAVAQITSAPSEPEGYYEGERVRVLVDFEQPVAVEGSPRLALEIGEHVRFAEFRPWIEDDWPPERPSWGQRFEYRVGENDEDLDGITIQADAFDFSKGTLLNAAGVEIEVEIYAVASDHITREHVQVEPGANLAPHAVIGRPEPRVCTDERQRALAYGGQMPVVGEWDGTPIRVDILRNFPEVVTEADMVQLLEPIALLDAKIEAQVGYRILEAGSVIPVPPGLPAGWNTDEQEYRRTCPLPRERGQILAFFMDDANHGDPTSDGQAQPWCGDFSYLRPVLQYWPCEGCERDALTLHELFHVLGYAHFFEEERLESGRGVPMSVALTWRGWPGADTVLWSDIDALHCIFPEGG